MIEAPQRVKTLIKVQPPLDDYYVAVGRYYVSFALVTTLHFTPAIRTAGMQLLEHAIHTKCNYCGDLIALG